MKYLGSNLFYTYYIYTAFRRNRLMMTTSTNLVKNIDFHSECYYFKYFLQGQWNISLKNISENKSSSALKTRYLTQLHYLKLAFSFTTLVCPFFLGTQIIVNLENSQHLINFIITVIDFSRFYYSSKLIYPD